jgi:hypothetical protein
VSISPSTIEQAKYPLTGFFRVRQKSESATRDMVFL